PPQPVSRHCVSQVSDTHPYVIDFETREPLAQCACIPPDNVLIDLDIQRIDPRPSQPARWRFFPNRRSIMRLYAIRIAGQAFIGIPVELDDQPFALDSRARQERMSVKVAVRSSAQMMLLFVPPEVVLRIHAVERDKPELRRYS